MNALNFENVVHNTTAPALLKKNVKIGTGAVIFGQQSHLYGWGLNALDDDGLDDVTEFLHLTLWTRGRLQPTMLTLP